MGRLDEILEHRRRRTWRCWWPGSAKARRRAAARCARSAIALGERWRLEVAERSLGAVVRAVEAAGGRILSVQPVRQSLEDYFFKEIGARRAARVGMLRGLSRVLAVATNTFRETIRERVLYNLVFFAILMTLSGLLLGQLSIRQDEKIIKDIGLAAMDAVRHADRDLHRAWASSARRSSGARSTRCSRSR